MKKLVSVIAVSLLVCGVVFAADPTVTVGGWGRFTNNLVKEADDGSDLSAGNAFNQVRFDVKGTSDNVGFLANVKIVDGAVAVGDNAKIWVKFNDMITLNGGRLKGDTIRGKIGGSDILSTDGEDQVFARFSLTSGYLVDIVPMKGVYAGVALEANAVMSDMFNAMQAGAGYTLEGLGLVRAQYIGNADSEMAKINAAFAYTAMAGLTVDAGIFVPMGDGTDMSIGAHAKYAKDALGVTVRTNTILADDLGLKVSVDGNYLVAKPLTAGVEAQFVDTTVKDADSTIELMPYAKIAYAKGYFKSGFDLAITGDTTTWRIPVLVSYSF